MAIENPTAWAIVDGSGAKICNYTAIISVDDSETATVPTEPIEGGKLAAFNKVPEPAEVSVSIAFDGDYGNQQDAISRIEQLRTTTETVSILSPSRIWRNMALRDYTYSRSAGAGGHLLQIDLTFIEVVSVNLSNTTAAGYSPKNPTSSKKKNTGKKQTAAAQKKDSLAYDLLFGWEEKKR